MSAPLRVLVCGGRDFTGRALMRTTLDGLHAACPFGHLIHGGARGADMLSGEWARSKGILMSVYPADWARHGRSAGYIRNRQMIVEGRPDLVVAFAGGPGTRDMVTQARKAGLRVELVGWEGA